MSTDSFEFASDREKLPPAPATASASPEPVPAATNDGTKPQVTTTAMQKAGNAMADLVMAAGVLVTAGIFGFVGYRKVSPTRMCIEAALAVAIMGGLYFMAGHLLHPHMDSLDLSQPLHRMPLLVLAAIILAYCGAIVVHRGWNHKGDPKVAMITLALGMTLIGLRITCLGMAYGEYRVANARIDAASAGMEALKQTADIVREQGGDTKPLAPIMIEFQKAVYGSEYASRVLVALGVKEELVDLDVDASVEPREAKSPPVTVIAPDAASK